MKEAIDPISSFSAPRKLIELFGLGWTKTSFRGVILHVMFIDIYLVLQLIYIFKLNDIAELSNLLKMCLTYVALLLKSINFIWKFGEIATLEKSLGDLTRFGTCERQHCNDKLSSCVNKVRRIFIVLWASSVVTVLLGAIAVIYYRDARSLPDKMWIPFDYRASEFRYLFVASFQIIGALYACSLNTALDIFPILRLSVLTNVIGNLRVQLSAVETNEQLKIATREHIRIRRCFKQLKIISSSVILAQAACSSIILCTTAFSLSTVS